MKYSFRNSPLFLSGQWIHNWRSTAWIRMRDNSTRLLDDSNFENNESNYIIKNELPTRINEQLDNWWTKVVEIMSKSTDTFSSFNIAKKEFLFKIQNNSVNQRPLNFSDMSPIQSSLTELNTDTERDKISNDGENIELVEREILSQPGIFEFMHRLNPGYSLNELSTEFLTESWNKNSMEDSLGAYDWTGAGRELWAERDLHWRPHYNRRYGKKPIFDPANVGFFKVSLAGRNYRVSGVQNKKPLIEYLDDPLGLYSGSLGRLQIDALEVRKAELRERRIRLTKQRYKNLKKSSNILNVKSTTRELNDNKVFTAVIDQNKEPDKSNFINKTDFPTISKVYKKNQNFSDLDLINESSIESNEPLNIKLKKYEEIIKEQNLLKSTDIQLKSLKEALYKSPELLNYRYIDLSNKGLKISTFNTELRNHILKHEGQFIPRKNIIPERNKIKWTLMQARTGILNSIAGYEWRETTLKNTKEEIYFPQPRNKYKSDRKSKIIQIKSDISNQPKFSKESTTKCTAIDGKAEVDKNITSVLNTLNLNIELGLKSDDSDYKKVFQEEVKKYENSVKTISRRMLSEDTNIIQYTNRNTNLLLDKQNPTHNVFAGIRERWIPGIDPQPISAIPSDAELHTESGWKQCIQSMKYWDLFEPMRYVRDLEDEDFVCAVEDGVEPGAPDRSAEQFLGGEGPTYHNINSLSTYLPTYRFHSFVPLTTRIIEITKKSGKKIVIPDIAFNTSRSFGQYIAFNVNSFHGTNHDKNLSNVFFENTSSDTVIFSKKNLWLYRCSLNPIQHYSDTRNWEMLQNMKFKGQLPGQSILHNGYWKHKLGILDKDWGLKDENQSIAYKYFLPYSDWDSQGYPVNSQNFQDTRNSSLLGYISNIETTEQESGPIDGSDIKARSSAEQILLSHPKMKYLREYERLVKNMLMRKRVQSKEKTVNDENINETETDDSKIFFNNTSLPLYNDLDNTITQSQLNNSSLGNNEELLIDNKTQILYTQNNSKTQDITKQNKFYNSYQSDYSNNFHMPKRTLNKKEYSDNLSETENFISSQIGTKKNLSSVGKWDKSVQKNLTDDKSKLSDVSDIMIDSKSFKKPLNHYLKSESFQKLKLNDQRNINDNIDMNESSTEPYERDNILQKIEEQLSGGNKATDLVKEYSDTKKSNFFNNVGVLYWRAGINFDARKLHVNRAKPISSLQSNLETFTKWVYYVTSDTEILWHLHGLLLSRLDNIVWEPKIPNIGVPNMVSLMRRGTHLRDAMFFPTGSSGDRNDDFLLKYPEETRASGVKLPEYEFTDRIGEGLNLGPLLGRREIIGNLGDFYQSFWLKFGETLGDMELRGITFDSIKALRLRLSQSAVAEICHKEIVSYLRLRYKELYGASETALDSLALEGFMPNNKLHLQFILMGNHNKAHHNTRRKLDNTFAMIHSERRVGEPVTFETIRSNYTMLDDNSYRYIKEYQKLLEDLREPLINNTINIVNTVRKRAKNWESRLFDESVVLAFRADLECLSRTYETTTKDLAISGRSAAEWGRIWGKQNIGLPEEEAISLIKNMTKKSTLLVDNLVAWEGDRKSLGLNYLPLLLISHVLGGINYKPLQLRKKLSNYSIAINIENGPSSKQLNDILQILKKSQPRLINIFDKTINIEYATQNILLNKENTIHESNSHQLWSFYEKFSSFIPTKNDGEKIYSINIITQALVPFLCATVKLESVFYIKPMSKVKIFYSYYNWVRILENENLPHEGQSKVEIDIPNKIKTSWLDEEWSKGCAPVVPHNLLKYPDSISDMALYDKARWSKISSRYNSDTLEILDPNLRHGVYNIRPKKDIIDLELARKSSGLAGFNSVPHVKNGVGWNNNRFSFSDIKKFFNKDISEKS